MKLTVNKLDAFRRQLKTAIEMVFEEKDPVAIHTLVMAAVAIIRDIQKSRDVEDKMDEILGPDLSRQYWSYARKPSNFFKHADKDPEGILEGFNINFNQVLIVYAISVYQSLGFEPEQHFSVYQQWFLIVHPHSIRETSLLKTLWVAAHKYFEASTVAGRSELAEIALNALRD